MKILIYRWSVFHQEDIAEAFESFGHTVEYYEEMPDERKGTDIRRLKEVVAEYDLVFLPIIFHGCLMPVRRSRKNTLHGLWIHRC